MNKQIIIKRLRKKKNLNDLLFFKKSSDALKSQNIIKFINALNNELKILDLSLNSTTPDKKKIILEIMKPKNQYLISLLKALIMGNPMVKPYKSINNKEAFLRKKRKEKNLNWPKTATQEERLEILNYILVDDKLKERINKIIKTEINFTLNNASLIEIMEILKYKNYNLSKKSKCLYEEYGTEPLFEMYNGEQRRIIQSSFDGNYNSIPKIIKANKRFTIERKYTYIGIYKKGEIVYRTFESTKGDKDGFLAEIKNSEMILKIIYKGRKETHIFKKIEKEVNPYITISSDLKFFAGTTASYFEEIKNPKIKSFNHFYFFKGPYKDIDKLNILKICYFMLLYLKDLEVGKQIKSTSKYYNTQKILQNTKYTFYKRDASSKGKKKIFKNEDLKLGDIHYYTKSVDKIGDLKEEIDDIKNSKITPFRIFSKYNFFSGFNNSDLDKNFRLKAKTNDIIFESQNGWFYYIHDIKKYRYIKNEDIKKIVPNQDITITKTKNFYHDSLIFNYKSQVYRIEKYNNFVGFFKIENNELKPVDITIDKIENKKKRKVLNLDLYKNVALFGRIKNDSFEHYEIIKKYYNIVKNINSFIKFTTKYINFIDEILKDESKSKSNDNLKITPKNKPKIKSKDKLNELFDSAIDDPQISFNKIKISKIYEEIRKSYVLNLFIFPELIIKTYINNDLNNSNSKIDLSKPGIQQIGILLSFLKYMMRLNNSKNYSEMIKVIEDYPFKFKWMMLYFEGDIRSFDKKKPTVHKNKNFVFKITKYIEIIENFNDDLHSLHSVYRGFGDIMKYIKSQAGHVKKTIKFQIENKVWFKKSVLLKIFTNK